MTVSGVIDTYSVLLEHPRYHLVLNISQGAVLGEEPRASIEGMIGHDLPMANVDYVVFENSYTEPAIDYFKAFASGVEGLSRLHIREGSPALGGIYGEISAGLRWLGIELGELAPDIIPPQRNKLIITSVPELAKFVKLPPSVHVGVLGEFGCSCACTCCCDCSCGAGCGCSIGLCIPETICGCCIGCGCGCSCSCSCGCGWCI